MLAYTVYYIWKERNARLYGEAPRNTSMIYKDIVMCIVCKVHLLRNMTITDINSSLCIVWGLSDDIFITWFAPF